MGRKLYVGNFPYETGEAALQELFARAGQPKELWVVDHARHGKCEKTAGSAYPRKLEEFFDRNIPA